MTTVTQAPPSEGSRQQKAELARVAQIFPPLEIDAGAIGRTMFDTPSSEDLAVTVLLCEERVQLLPSQSLVRIVSRGDGKRYLGVVTAGPFAEPDSLRADSAVLVSVATRGAQYLPRFHGRVRVTILAEELPDGTQAPPRLRPLPHSPVYLLDAKETARLLLAEGDIRLGLAVGLDGVEVRLPSAAKAVLPRHTAILGTTGGGKSTTVANLVCQAVEAGMAVVLLDVEGEYTNLHEPTADPRMQRLLADRKLKAGGLRADRMGVYHLVGRETTNPAHPGRRPFSLQFARLSPYTVAEMLALTEAQTDRYLFAYEAAKGLLRDLGIFPQQGVSEEERQRQEQIALRLDEFERGYPRLRLSFLLDVVGQCKALVNKARFMPFNEELRTEEGRESLCKHLNAKEMPGNAASWGKLHSTLWRLHRLRVFDRDVAGGTFLRYREMLQPGRLSVVDLSDAGLTELSNIAVADVLRGIQEEQERVYRTFEVGKTGPPPRVLLVIEEAHEFLGAERADKTPHLFAQVARIAKRGRKRWLGLAFVTQLPGHLPRQVLSLVNNYVMHKITDPHVISMLRHTAGGIDDSLWSRLPGLAPGQAIVSLGHMARPVLVSMDPAGCKLRMVE
jgi:DNA helicase HerA-like ATPase